MLISQILRSFILFFTCTFLVIACKSEKKILPPATMEKVLLDLTFAEAYSTITADSLHKYGTKNFDSLGVFYKEIFAHYKITPREFEESLNWYKNNPAEMDSAYSRIQVTVTQWQGKYPAAPHTPAHIPPPIPLNAGKPVN